MGSDSPASSGLRRSALLPPMKPPQRGWGLVSSFAPSLRSENLSLVRHQEVLSRRGPNGATSTPVLQTYVNRSCFTYVLTRSISPKILACDWGSSIIGVVPITTLSRFTIGAERPLSSYHAANPRPITRFLYMIESIYPRSTPPLVESLRHHEGCSCQAAAACSRWGQACCPVSCRGCARAEFRSRSSSVYVYDKIRAWSSDLWNRRSLEPQKAL